MSWGGTFDYDLKSERLTEVKRELENPDIWNNVEKAQALGKEKASLEGIVNTLDNIKISCFDSKELLFLAIEENDQPTINEITTEAKNLNQQVGLLEFNRMFNGEMDLSNAFLDIQSGAGGTEAQDWAEMLLRMYLRWAESHEFSAEIIEVSSGDVAGIKSATIKIIIRGWIV